MWVILNFEIETLRKEQKSSKSNDISSVNFSFTAPC